MKAEERDRLSYIELNEIDYSYKDDGTEVLHGFSLSVEKGECLILEGDNGSGKTTVFRILNGLAFPDRGSYFFDGQEITAEYLKKNEVSKRFHKRVGYLFQNPDVMLFNPRVYDEIAFGPRQMGLSDGEVEARVTDLLRLLDIEALRDKTPYHLSVGQKKRVALAAVLALSPEVLILDEPLAGLDAGGRAWLMDFLAELKRSGRTILIATHEEALIERLGDRRVQM